MQVRAVGELSGGVAFAAGVRAAGAPDRYFAHEGAEGGGGFLSCGWVRGWQARREADSSHVP